MCYSFLFVYLFVCFFFFFFFFCSLTRVMFSPHFHERLILPRQNNYVLLEYVFNIVTMPLVITFADFYYFTSSLLKVLYLTSMLMFKFVLQYFPYHPNLILLVIVNDIVCL